MIATATGVDQIALAVRTQQTRRGAQILVRGTVLLREVDYRLGGGRARRAVGYDWYVRELWKRLYGTPPDGFGKYDLALPDLIHRLRTTPTPVQNPALVIVQGQKLDVDFYTVLRDLQIKVTVYVDAIGQAGQGVSSLREIVTALGAVEGEPERMSASTGSILRFVEGIDAVPQRYLATTESAAGPKPLLVHHDAPSDEARWIATYARAHPGQTVGVLLHTAEAVERYVSLLRREDELRPQWYLGRGKVPGRERLQPGAPGIKVLTWASAEGVPLDHVILPNLDWVNESVLGIALQGVASCARHGLVLSYCGEGEPTALSIIPRHLVDEPSSRTFQPSPASMARMRTEQDAAVEAARRVLSVDRADPRHRKRVLTQPEEKGLATLMRGEHVPLSTELPKKFRSGLDDDDERALAFDAMVTHNEGLVHLNAKSYSVPAFEYADLVQYGVLGLIRAVEKFDAGAGTKFSTYAMWWIKQAITRAIPNEGQMIRVPVHMWEHVQDVIRARAALGAGNGPASVADLARRTGLSPDKVELCLRILSGVLSLDAPVGGDTDVTLAEFLADTEVVDFDEMWDRRETAQLVRAAVRSLGQRQASVVEMRFGFDDNDPQTLDKIGEQLSVTRERVRQIEAKAKERLRVHLTDTPHMPAPRRPARSPVPLRRVPVVVQPEVTREITIALPDPVVEPPAARVARLIADRVVDTGTRDVTVLLDPGSYVGFTYTSCAGVRQGATGDRFDVGAWFDPRTLAAVLNTFGSVRLWDASQESGVVLDRVDAGLRLSPTTDTLPRAFAPALGRTSSAVVLELPRAGGDSLVTAEDLRRELGVALAPALRTDQVVISVNGTRVPPRDPFLWFNPAGQDLGEERVSEDGLVAHVRPHVLPHWELLRAGDVDNAGEPGTWSDRQGIYLRCGLRFLLCGSGWLGLPDCVSAPEYALARVEIDIAPEERAAWGIGGDGPIRPPQALRQRLAALAGVARSRSAAVVAAHREDGHD